MAFSKYLFEKKDYLTDKELEEYFEIEKPFYLKIFGEIKEGLKEKFFYKRKSLFHNNDFYNYKITYNKELCGYISFLIYNNKLFLYDITFSNKYKGTRLILETIQFVLQNKELSNFNTLYFAVDNKNDISYKTWNHLGAKLDQSHDIKSSYYIDRKVAEKYITKIIKR